MKTQDLIFKLGQEGCIVERYGNYIISAISENRMVSFIDNNGNAIAFNSFIENKNVYNSFLSAEQVARFLTEGRPHEKNKQQGTSSSLSVGRRQGS